MKTNFNYDDTNSGTTKKDVFGVKTSALFILKIYSDILRISTRCFMLRVCNMPYVTKLTVQLRAEAEKQF